LRALGVAIPRHRSPLSWGVASHIDQLDSLSRGIHDAPMKKATLNWLQSAAYDVKTAEALLNNRRYIYVVFLCHLALEKTLKAILAESQTTLPPYTHNLNRLLELAHIQLPEAEQSFINVLNLQSVPMRYPEDFKRLAKEFDQKIAGGCLKQTKGLVRWLRRNTPHLRSEES